MIENRALGAATNNVAACANELVLNVWLDECAGLAQQAITRVASILEAEGGRIKK